MNDHLQTFQYEIVGVNGLRVSDPENTEYNG